MKRVIILSVLFFMCIMQTSWGQIPQKISYQGILQDTSGIVVHNGDYILTFKLYNVATGGTPLWEEQQTVAVKNGIFNAILGGVYPLTLSFNEPYWLGVTVENGDELTPRIELTASPYALNTQSMLDGGWTEDIANNTIYMTNSGRNVGIGTTNPQNTLDVNGTIQAKEIRVSPSGWSDFVFAEKYPLMPLDELEQSIRQNKHLPDIPSAEEVAENGIV